MGFRDTSSRRIQPQKSLRRLNNNSWNLTGFSSISEGHARSVRRVKSKSERVNRTPDSRLAIIESLEVALKGTCNKNRSHSFAFERSQGGREPMKWGKAGKLVDIYIPGVHLQAHNARKGSNPSAHRCNNLSPEVDEQRSGVKGWGGGRIWKPVFPRLQLLTGVERDIGEEVLPGTWNP